MPSITNITLLVSNRAQNRLIWLNCQDKNVKFDGMQRPSGQKYTFTILVVKKQNQSIKCIKLSDCNK